MEETTLRLTDRQAKKLAGKILRRLKFDNVTTRNTCRLIRYHDLRPTPDAEDVRRAVNLIGEELFPLYLKVQKADLLSQSTYRREEKLARLSGVTEAYQGILERGECTSLKTLAVSGKDLIKAGHPPDRHWEHCSKDFLTVC